MIVRGGTVVTERGVEQADIAIANGQITEVGPGLRGGGEEIDASGLHVFPGGIDSHVHFNEPGRTEWETIANGSAALAAGGYTTFIDMPLNNLPVTTDVAAFDLKRQAMERSSLIDFGLWAGLVPGNVKRVEELAERGAMGFKAFMCPSGIPEFPPCDERTLRDAMKRIARLDSILLLHAEDPSKLREPKGPSARDFLDSRPEDAETSAVGQATAWASRYGNRLHIVHLSLADSAAFVGAGQGKGIDVSGETCPHYLLYSEDELATLGGIGKCAPPFRSRDSVNRLWNALLEGWIEMVVSDHSPSTLLLKEGDDFTKIWGGISGCQSTRQLLLAKEWLDLPIIASLTSTNIARRFRLDQKGDIAPGFDADLWLVDLSSEDVVRREDLLYLNPFSVHEGQPIRGKTVRTLVRGRTVFPDGQQVGEFIRPGASS